jgi:hypothetical protein
VKTVTKEELLKDPRDFVMLAMYGIVCRGSAVVNIKQEEGTLEEVIKGYEEYLLAGGKKYEIVFQVS